MTIEVKNKSMQLQDLGLIDPRLIITMSVISLKNIQVQYLNDLAPLAEKVIINLPELNDVAGIQIKSVQYLTGANSIIAAEIVGAMTPEVRAVVAKVLETMKNSKVTNAFFPGNMSKTNRIRCFVGRTVDELCGAPANIRNLRIADDKYLIFSDFGKIKKMSIRDYYKPLNNWTLNSFTLWTEENQEIKFLGRIQSGFVPVTLNDGTIAQLDAQSGRKEPVVKTFTGITKTLAYIGEVFGGKHAAISGNQLVTA